MRTSTLRRRAAGLTALLLSILVGSAGAQKAPPTGPPPRDSSVPTTPATQPDTIAGAIRAVPVAFTVKADKKTYKVGEPIKLALLIKNTRKQPVKLTFASGLMYDVEIRKGIGRSGASVWKWSQGQMFTQMVTSQTLKPGASQNYTVTYDPSAAANSRMPALQPGKYMVGAYLMTMGRAPRPSAFTPITVR